MDKALLLLLLMLFHYPYMKLHNKSLCVRCVLLLTITYALKALEYPNLVLGYVQVFDSFVFLASRFEMDFCVLPFSCKIDVKLLQVLELSIEFTGWMLKRNYRSVVVVKFVWFSYQVGWRRKLSFVSLKSRFTFDICGTRFFWPQLFLLLLLRTH